jgi:PEP-CTERM motif
LSAATGRFVPRSHGATNSHLGGGIVTRTSCWLAALALVVGAVDRAQASVVLFTNQAAFQAQGNVTLTSNFNDFGPGFTFPGDPFTRGGVTYTSGANLIIGPATFYAPVQNMMFFNGWTPLTGNISTSPNHYSMFGFNTGVASFDGSNSLVNLLVTTNLGSYSFTGLSLPMVSTGLGFLGVVTNNPSEFFTGFSLSTQNGPGWAAGMTNVQLGAATVPEPTTLAAFGLMAVGGLGYVRRRKLATA